MKNNILIVLMALACTPTYSQNTHADVIKEKSFKNSSFLMIYEGGFQVKDSKVVKSDLIITNGDLIVDGTFEGEAVIDNGNLIVNQTGMVTGKVTIIDGRVVLQGAEIDQSLVDKTTWAEYVKRPASESDNARNLVVVVPDLPELPTADEGMENKRDEDLRKGLEKTRRDIEAMNKEMKERPKEDMDSEELNGEGVEVGQDEWSVRPWNNWKTRYPSQRDYRITDYDNGYFAFDYNRVDGLYLGAKIDRRNDRFKSRPFGMYGEIGYAFSEKNLRYQIGLDRRWGRAFRFEVGGEVHDLTASQDEWIVGHVENALNALLFKNDYKDHFRNRGYSFHVSQNLNPFLKVTATFSQDDYYSLHNHVNWSIFMPSQDFRVNPAIDEGRLSGLSTMAELDNVQYLRYGRKNFRRIGWHVVGAVEKGIPSWDSDFSFVRYTLNVTRYQPLSKWENLDMRLWLGTSTGDLPLQKSFYAGGLSTLRGHSYKEFTGNNVALLNVEYRISPTRFDRDRVLFIHPMNFILFMDNGYAWTSEMNSYRHLYRGFDWNKVETDIGVGLGDEKDMVRLDIAKNVSRKGSDYKMMLRINYAF